MKFVNKKHILIAVFFVFLIIIAVLLGNTQKSEEFTPIEEFRFDNYVIRIKDYIFDEGTGYGECEFVILEKSGNKIEIENIDRAIFDDYKFGINTGTAYMESIECVEYKDNAVMVRIEFYNGNFMPETKLVLKKQSESDELVSFRFKDTDEKDIYLKNENGNSICISAKALRINGNIVEEIELLANYKDGRKELISEKVMKEYSKHEHKDNCLIISKSIEKIDIENIDTIEYEDDVYTVR